MDCKDLMVGDWVSYLGFYNKVIYIGQKVSMYNGKGTEFTTDPEHIRPIPLIEEILVKNGFRYTANVIGRHNCKCYELEQKGVYDMTISIYKNQITCELDKIDAMYMNVVINYVHELQHLLRLCGIEKELVID